MGYVKVYSSVKQICKLHPYHRIEVLPVLNSLLRTKYMFLSYVYFLKIPKITTK